MSQRFYFVYNLLKCRILQHYAAGVARGSEEGRQHDRLLPHPHLPPTSRPHSLKSAPGNTSTLRTGGNQRLQPAQRVGLVGGWDQ